MIGTIAQIDTDQLRLLLQRPWVRRITSVHIHHTWRPDHSQWRGQASVEAIRRYHVDELGWADIAEHLTIGPDGSLWTGRNLDMPPASISGHNGTASEGPFMIEMVGNFDVGQDVFGGAQAASVYATVARICNAFHLDVQAIRFHNEFTNAKTCPGTSLNLADFRVAVKARMKEAAPAAPPLNAAARAYAAQAVAATPPAGARALEDATAQPHYDAELASRSWGDEPADGARGLFGSPFSAADTEVFRSHVVNLAGGQLSGDGYYSNTEADLDELIARLDKWASTQGGKPVRIALYAHGGLVNEKNGLGVAVRDYQWWKGNDVYPIFFVWESGFLEVFKQAWQREQDGAQRAFFTDPVIESLLGPTAGLPAWDRMKVSALLASSDVTGTGKPGGAMLFLHKLAAWAKARQGGKLELHAVCHSAGAIFQCHLLPAVQRAFAGMAAQAPAPLVSTLTFLAPAVRVDLFRQMLQPLIESGVVGATTMFTMERRREVVDNVAFIYRKSLLYFVRNACERPTYSTPILGLDESMRGDPALMDLFGLGAGPGKAEVVWSRTDANSGRSATQSLHHGDFDNDSPTMNSLMRRILTLEDSAGLPCPHVPQDKPADDASRELALGASPFITRASNTGGALSALCIGIDDYGPQSLTGCVADSQSFAAALRQWGFSVQNLTNAQATRQGISSAMEQLLANSQAGDVVVIQYAGHGTQLPDLNGDESDGFDEAWVPHDYDQGEYVIDDDLGALFDRHQGRGVQLIVFTDCCHSGSSTRFLLRADAPQRSVRSRYLQLTDAQVARYRNRRALAPAAPPNSALPTSATSPRATGADSLGWEIHFAACQDRQSAYERDGHGDFTQATTRALAAALASPGSYTSLAASIAAAFAGNALQMPQLRAPAASAAQPLFGAARGAAGLRPQAQALAANGLRPAQASGTAQDISARLDALTLAVQDLSRQIADL